MTDRWWAPQRATLEMDAVVKVIFDTPGDVATALLGAHRAGAAAVETVAKGAVPSEMGLVKAMAAARERFAPAMVESLATATGSGSYAGLLARDVLDAAEVGALDLFRTCVAKGISPPLAAQRAGAVYGVPMRELGLYTPLAIDPKSNPLALTDAADRAMLTYFDKISKTETFESVSKAPGKAAAAPPPRGQHGRWIEEEHPRNDQAGHEGEFVQIGRLRIPVKRDEEAEEAPEQEREQREVREVREVRQVRQVAPPTPGGQRQIGIKRQVGERQVGERQVGRANVSGHELVTSPSGVGPGAPPDDDPTPPYIPQDLMAKPNPEDTFDYQKIAEPLVITMDFTEGRELRTKMPGNNTEQYPQMFRLGYLLALADEPEIMETPGAVAQGEGRAKIIRDDYERSLGYTFPKVQDNPEGLAGRGLLKEYMSGGDPMEKMWIASPKDYETHQEVLVYWQPSKDAPGGAWRPQPSIDEYVITTGALGEIDTGGWHHQHLRIKLDPNQVMKLPLKPEIFYDKKRHVLVNRFELQFVDDDVAEWKHDNWKEAEKKREFGKAAGESQHWRVQPRGKHGQWIDEVVARQAEQEQAEQPEETRQVREVREVRQVKRAELANPVIGERQIGERQVGEREVGEREVGRKLTERQLASLNRPIDERDPAMPVLDDRPRYRVHTWREFESILGTQRGEVFATRPWQVNNPRMYASLLTDSGHMLTGMGVSAKLGDNVERAVLANEGHLYDSWEERRQPLGKGLVMSDADWATLGDRIRHIQKIRPEIAQINVVYGSGYDYTIVGSLKPVEDQIVLEYDDDIDFTKPIVLDPLGRFHSSEMWREGPDGADVPLSEIEDQNVNAPVRIMRVHNAGVRRFRVGNA